MARIGLALSGGGSKGAFTVGVLKVIDQILDPQPYPVVSGTSTGSLVGSLVATNQMARLIKVYSNVTTSQIVNPNHALVANIAGPEAVLFASAILGGRAIFDTKALLETIKNNADFNKLKAVANKTLLIYNAVNLQTGQLETFNNRDHSAATLLKGLLASANQPVLTDPVEFQRGNKLHQLVDGGVTEFLPLRAIFDSGVELDHIIAVSTAPRGPKPRPGGRIDKITDILTRTVDLLATEIGRDDFTCAQLFNTILTMMRNAEAEGVPMSRLMRDVPAEVRRRVRDKRAVPISFLGPERHIKMDGLTFDPPAMRVLMKEGVKVGKKLVPKIEAALA